MREVGPLDDEGARRGEDACGVLLQRLAGALGERVHDGLGGVAQRGIGQPLAGQRVVLDGIVQPTGRDLFGAAAPRRHPVGDRREVFGVRVPVLVGLPRVRVPGDLLDLGQAQVVHATHRRHPTRSAARGPAHRRCAGD